MISNAKGRHVSPGVYTEEKDIVFSTKSLGITSLGLVGETLYGPAFENIEISEWNDFVDYFGGTSSELYKNTGMPKYELPYIAKSYLSKSKRLNVVRVLGFSGYDAGKCWVVEAKPADQYEVEFETTGVTLSGSVIFTNATTMIGEGDDEKQYIKIKVTESESSTAVSISDYYYVEYNTDGYEGKMSLYNDDKSPSEVTINFKEKLSDDESTKPLVIIRSKKIMGGIGGDICNAIDSCTDMVSAITIGNYNGDTYTTFCPNDNSSNNGASLNVDKKLSIKATLTDGTTEVYNVSLDPRDSDNIYRVISSSPQDTKQSSIYIEAVYENALDEANYIIKMGEAKMIDSEDYSDYKGQYRCALTPWLLSEVSVLNTEKSNNSESGTCATASKAVSMRRLFRFLTISDGDASNFQVKVSIEKIDPSTGTFDVVVRDFNDTDSNIVVLEKFAKCSLKKGDASYIGYKIGTSDGLYGNRSKYITVEMYSDEDMEGSVPCGFLGYPTPNYDCGVAPEIKYRTTYNPRIKERKQYFGFSNVDSDILTYKGRCFYIDDTMTPKYNDNGEMCMSSGLVFTKGFHMDSILSEDCLTIYIDGENVYDRYTFDCVSTDKVTSDKFIPRLVNMKFNGGGDYIDQTIYKNEKLRKFTVGFYGGFDGWDINRNRRTNTDEYNVNNYGTTSAGYETFINAVEYKLPSYVNTSDYYAYLAGYKVFSNPQDVDINIFATPGIDWYNNTLLTKDAIEVIEDPEDGRGGDALYIMNAPYGINDANEMAMMFSDTDINSSYACTYAPWILYKDTVRNQYLYLPPTKDVVRNIADTDNTSFPWFAPAGTTRGVVECEKAEYKTTLDDEDTLYENRINPIKTFGKDGVIVWGNKTAYDVESPINRINVRRLMIRVKKLITSAAKHLIFEQYDDAVEKQFRGLVDPILADVKSNRGIYDYRIQTEVTPETRDQHILPAKIMIKPTPALEYISITFVVYPESVEFTQED